MGIVAIWMQAHNAEKTLARAIESILCQSYTEWEFHILDNGSTDRTNEIIQEYAQQDDRFTVYNAVVNDNNTFGYISELIEDTTADWFVRLDADDEYTTDFLEKMISFAEREQLDAVACGYEKICGQTGKVLKRRALGYDLTISGADFADRFIEYRGFTPYYWAKLTSVRLLKENAIIHDGLSWSMYMDSITSLKVFQKSNRAGIHSEPMYKYYQYPSSLSHQVNDDSLASYNDYWRSIKEYIESYGPISRMNDDFLYAIYLSMMEDNIYLVYASSLDFFKKIDLIKKIFKNPIATETLNRKADPVFRNLAGRKQFIQNVIDWIKSQQENRIDYAGEILALLSAIASNLLKADKDI